MTERELLEAVFPAQPITDAILDEPTSGIENHDRGALVRPWLVGRTWRDLDAAFVEAFHELLIYAGPATFATLLPAYLAFLAEHDRFSDALYVVGNQLTRKDDAVSQRTFGARVAALTAEQRAVVQRLIARLSLRPAMERALRPVVASWSGEPS